MVVQGTMVPRSRELVKKLYFEPRDKLRRFTLFFRTCYNLKFKF